jgi:cytochrome c peroxidase
MPVPTMLVTTNAVAPHRFNPRRRSPVGWLGLGNDLAAFCSGAISAVAQSPLPFVPARGQACGHYTSAVENALQAVRWWMAHPRQLWFNPPHSIKKWVGGSRIVDTQAFSHLFKRVIAAGFLLVLTISSVSWLLSVQAQTSPVGALTSKVTYGKLTPPQQLGERLFRDERFTAPNGDFATSCRTCHLFDEDPQGQRAYTDFFNLSWVPHRSQDPRRSAVRNSPTLYDVGLMPRLHLDGEFASLEDLVKGTLGGRPLGWLPGEEAQAFAQVRNVLVGDKGIPSYAQQFKQVYRVELLTLSESAVVTLVAGAVADYIRTFKSPQNAPFDRFLRANNLAWPTGSQDVSSQTQQFVSQLEILERSKALKLGKDFNAEALQGLKMFLRTKGESSVGNCVTCHAPPLFTDFSFHNLGVSQAEYDQLHGVGAFAALSIPNVAEAQRPSPRYRETPSKRKPGEVDLGHWNIVDVKRSPLRRAEESDEQFLQRMIGTFKTPTLRHLAHSYPYFHNGIYTSLEDTLREIMRLSELARAGRVRQADPQLARIKLNEADLGPLMAFLNTLNEGLKVVAF